MRLGEELGAVSFPPATAAEQIAMMWPLADAGVVVRPTAGNAPRVHEARRAFGAPLDAAGVTWADFAEEGSSTRFGLPPRRIDITQRNGRVVGG